MSERAIPGFAPSTTPRFALGVGYLSSDQPGGGTTGRLAAAATGNGLDFSPSGPKYVEKHSR
jgi:hypothetical protein